MMLLWTGKGHCPGCQDVWFEDVSPLCVIWTSLCRLCSFRLCFILPLPYSLGCSCVGLDTFRPAVCAVVFPVILSQPPVLWWWPTTVSQVTSGLRLVAFQKLTGSSGGIWTCEWTEAQSLWFWLLSFFTLFLEMLTLWSYFCSFLDSPSSFFFMHFSGHLYCDSFS